MKDHWTSPHLALAIILGAMIWMVAMGQKLDAMATLGFGIAIGNITAGFSGSFSDRKGQSQVTNLPNATTANVNNDQAPGGTS